MGKRPRSETDARKKRYKVSSGIIDPGIAGVYASCPRSREKQCMDELLNLFTEKIEEYGIKPLETKEQEPGKEMSLEESIAAELAELKDEGKKNEGQPKLVEPIRLDQECIVFIKLRRPIDPEKFVHDVVADIYNLGTKRTKYTQKLSPVQHSCNATVEELQKLSKKVMERHFHTPGAQGIKYAIHVNRRNFSALEKMDIIRKVAECMGHDQGHVVDLKNYDKLILVECFKNNIGMSVLEDYLKYNRYNLDQMFEQAGASRVGNTGGAGGKKGKNGESKKEKLGKGEADGKKKQKEQ